MKKTWQFPLILLVPLFFLGGSSIVQADPELEKQFPVESGTKDSKFLKKYEDKIQEIQKELKHLKIAVPDELSLEDDDIAFLLETPSFSQIRHGNNQYRYLMGRFVVVNQSSRSIVLNTKMIRLQFHGKEFVNGEKKELGPSANLQIQSRSYNFSQLKFAEKLTVPAHHTASCWVAFLGLPPGNDTPELYLKWNTGNTPYSLNVSLQHQAILKWRREQIGPQGVISLCTIGGKVNTVNLKTMMDTFVNIATQKVSRTIVAFEDDAPELENIINQWLPQTSAQAGIEKRHFQQTSLPTVPAMIQSFHLANLPEKSSSSYRHSSYGRSARVHKTINDAIVSISETAYDVLPVPALVNEIEHGNSLTKPAAIIHGAPRLPEQFYPLIKKFAVQTKNPLLKNAAIHALGEFNLQDAANKLEQFVRSEDEDVSQAAITSLTVSRFPLHQKKILALTDQIPETQERVIKTLAKFPRKQWGPILYQQSQTGTVPIRIEAVKGLNAIGHYGLHKVLISYLEGSVPELQKVAFEILSQSANSQSKQTIIKYTLDRIDKGDIDSQVLQMVKKYQIPEAVPGLLKLLKKESPHKATLIQTLTEISDNGILSELIKIYPKLKQSHEKTVTLQAIAKIDQNQLIKMAPEIIKTKDSQVVSTVFSILQAIPSDESIEVLVDAIDICEGDSYLLSRLTNTLGYVSTPKSRDYLIQLKKSSSEKKRQLAKTVLDRLYARSPFRYLCNQADTTARSGKYELALKQYTLIIDGESDYPAAYAGRGKTYSALQQHEKAIADYDQLLKIDDRWPQIHGLKGRDLTALSRFTEAVKSLTSAIEFEPKIDDWYSSRGHAFSMLENFEAAEKDYRKALELDPQNMTALTGVALSLAVSGKIDEAVAQLKRAEAEHGKEPVFAYNVACTYARSAEYLQKRTEKTAEDKKQINELIEKSLDELERSISLGYSDAKWAIKDPDLVMIKEHQRFDELLNKMGKSTPEKKTPKTLKDKIRP